MKTTTTTLFSSLAISLLVVGPAVAGSLDPPAAPAPTMVTLQQIYDAAKPPGCFNNSPSGLRFVDCGNGTVQDTQTSLVWLKNANCLPVGGSDWAAANRRAAKLAEGSTDGNACGLSDGSKAGAWRLPTKAEWEALVLTAQQMSCFSPPLTNAAGTGCYATGAWATGVQTTTYWSATTFASNSNLAWFTDMFNGILSAFNKTANENVWPVRGGQ